MRWRTQAVLGEQNEGVFAELAAFARTMAADFGAGRPGRREIPTALLSAGINVSDHITAFAGLKRHLAREVTPYLAILYARDCYGGLKGLMKQLLGQLFSCTRLDLFTDDGVNPGGFQADGGAKPRLASADLHMFTAWFHAQKANRQPVVVVLQDFEAFDSKVVSALVEILSSHLAQLPLVLVFGIASSPDMVYSLMTRETIARLNIQRFRLRDSSVNLPDLYE